MALQETPGSPDMGVVQFRIERGAAAMGADGQLGTVEQIVVDRGSGELRALVVRRPDGQEFELPATHVQRATGDHVYLDIGAADLANNPEIAAPYDPEQYVPVYEGQMAPTGHAARAARDTERPVVTNVEEDAAQVIVPTTSADAGAATGTDADATMTLPRTPGVETQPAPQPSPVESTTGDLMGGKPSTSGMSAASTIPPSSAPPQDTPGTERDSATFDAPAQRAYTDAAEASDPGMRSAFSAGAERHLAERVEPLPDEYDRSQDAEDLAQAPVTSEPDIAEQETVILSQQLLKPGELGMATGEQETADLSQPEPSMMDTETPHATPAGDASQAPASTPITRPLAPTGETAGQNPFVPPAGMLAALGLAAGVLAGLIAARRRRQASASQQVHSKASQLASAVTETAGNVQDTLKDSLQNTAKTAQTKAQRAGRQTQKTAKRASRRFRWFRRGLYLGSALALLYAPRSGEETRSRLAARLDEWRSRTAS